jgi:hypothetical protein
MVTSNPNSAVDLFYILLQSTAFLNFLIFDFEYFSNLGSISVQEFFSMFFAKALPFAIISACLRMRMENLLTKGISFEFIYVSK